MKADGSTESDLNTIYYHVTDYLDRALYNLRKSDDGFRRVVFVDDLNRCSPAKALEVLESIKSFFDIEGIEYVIGMNYHSVEALIKKKYDDKTIISAFDYMKKIVQLPFQIPDWAETDISKFIDDVSFDELGGSEC